MTFSKPFEEDKDDEGEASPQTIRNYRRLVRENSEYALNQYHKLDKIDEETVFGSALNTPMNDNQQRLDMKNRRDKSPKTSQV
jgi:hypothetical protein